jgi:DNA polymerase-3 subunit alpha
MGPMPSRSEDYPELVAAGAWDEVLDYRKRLEFEIAIINRMGFGGYFLIVADFIKWAKDHDIPVGPGRGRGSLVAWALTITDLDPIKLGLLFERFLNPERVSMPDFDIDFCETRRGEVIRYVQAKYGADHVAQIITFGKLGARRAARYGPHPANELWPDRPPVQDGAQPSHRPVDAGARAQRRGRTAARI